MSARRLAPRRRLSREIGAVLLFKLLALTLLWLVCFTPAHRPAIDPAALFAPPSSTVPFPPATR